MFIVSNICMVCVCLCYHGWTVSHPPFMVLHTLPLTVADEVTSRLNGRSDLNFRVKSISDRLAFLTYCWGLFFHISMLSVKVYIVSLANKSQHVFPGSVQNGGGIRNSIFIYTILFQDLSWTLYFSLTSQKSHSGSYRVWPLSYSESSYCHFKDDV